MKHTIKLILCCAAILASLAGCSKGGRVINTLDDAQDKKIGVMTGAIGEPITKARFPQAEVKSFDDIMDGVAAMKSGQIDAIVTAYPTALNIAKKNADLRILEESLDNEDTAVAIRKGDEQLLADVNQVIDGLTKDGTLAAMKQRWLKADATPYEAVEIAVPTQGKPLRVGVSATREPLTFVDQSGKITGLDGEVARRIGAKLGRPIEFVDMKFMALIPALQSGKVDMIISGMNATEERKQSVNFSRPYFANSQVMLVKKAPAENDKQASSDTWDPTASDAVARLKQLDGKKIGVMTGTTGEAAALAQFPKAELKRFDDAPDIVTALQAGQINAAIVSRSSTALISKAHPALQALPDRLLSENIAMAIRKGDEVLLRDVNRAISELKADGTLAAMDKRWFKTDATPYEEIKVAPPKEGTVLKIGVTAALEPFVFVDGTGRITGHDCELAQRIGAKLKRPVEFSNMKFAALIPALQSGKIDIIISSMTATEERQKSVNFTQPYFSDTQVVLTKMPAGTKVLPSAAVPANRGHTLQQLDGQRIGVLSGSAGDLAARQRFPKAAILDMNAAADAALALKSGKADAFVYDKSVLLNLAAKNPELVILDEPVAKLQVAAALGKNQPVLLSALNKALGDLKRDGTLQRLRQKWIESTSAAEVLPPAQAKHDKGVLKVGTNATIEPFSFISNGKIVGLDIELAQLLGERLGKRIEIVNMPFESLIPALQAGKIDFALSNLNVTEERKKLINFSLPYTENDISALVRRDPNAALPSGTAGGDSSNGGKLSSPADLKDKRLGVLLGSEQDRYVMRNYPQATVLQYKSPSDLVLAVKSGKVDAGLYTTETLQAMFRGDDELGLIGAPLYAAPIAMGFKKGNNALRERFNEFLRQIKGNGVYDDMVERWVKKGTTTMPEIAHPKPKGVLVVGTVSDKGLPFGAIQNNQLIGFDTELCYRFGAYLGKEVRFTDMEFGSLIAAVSTDKIDMVASTLMVTEERKQQIAFSDVYYQMGSSAFALKKNIVAQDAQPETKPVEPSFLGSVADSFDNNIIKEQRYLLILDGLKVTVIVAVLASVFGTILGALVCFMRMSKSAILNVPAKVYISILRGTPVLVLLMLIFYVVFASVDIDPVLVAVIAFGMNFAAYAAEIFRSGIEGVDKGQTEAGIAMGFTKTNTFLYIVLPQAVRQFLPVYKGEFISLVKMTSVVGYIAVQDLTKASDIIRSRTFDAFFPLIMVAVLYFVISWFLTQSLEYLERATDPKHKRKKAGKA